MKKDLNNRVVHINIFQTVLLVVCYSAIIIAFLYLVIHQGIINGGIDDKIYSSFSIPAILLFWVLGVYEILMSYKIVFGKRSLVIKGKISRLGTFEEVHYVNLEHIECTDKEFLFGRRLFVIKYKERESEEKRFKVGNKLKEVLAELENKSKEYGFVLKIGGSHEQF